MYHLKRRSHGLWVSDENSVWLRTTIHVVHVNLILCIIERLLLIKTYTDRCTIKIGINDTSSSEIVIFEMYASSSIFFRFHHHFLFGLSSITALIVKNTRPMTIYVTHSGVESIGAQYSRPVASSAYSYPGSHSHVPLYNDSY